MRITATITDKGQVTIPKPIRKHFKGRLIEFVLADGRIEIREIPSAGGILSEYAKEYVPIETVREKTWGSGSDEN